MSESITTLDAPKAGNANDKDACCSGGASETTPAKMITATEVLQRVEVWEKRTVEILSTVHPLLRPWVCNEVVRIVRSQKP